VIWVAAVCALVVVIGVCAFAIGVMVGHDQATGARMHWTYRDEQWAQHLEEEGQ
jgi:hypothetical protein